MIARRIFEGESAIEVGISAADYASRRATLDRYLQSSGGTFDETDYLAWLQTDQAGWSPDQPSRGLGDTLAKITHKTGLVRIAEAYTKITGRDCGCGQRQQALNRLKPYKIERV